MKNSTANTGRVLKNTIFMFFRMMVVMLIGLFTSRVILNTLGVEDYGVYNVVGGVVFLFSFLKNALTNATYRFFAYDMGRNEPERMATTFSMSINVHLILAAIILLLCETFGLWFLNHKLVIPEGRELAANIAFQFSILTFCLGIIQTPYNSVIIAHEQMNFYAITSIAEALLKLGTAYFLIILVFDKLIVYAILVFIVALLMLSWYMLWCRRKYSECRYRPCWDKGLFTQLMQYSGWSSVVNVTDIAVSQSIVFFFNIFFGVVANAALGIANQVNGMLNHFLGSFTQSFNPQIIKSYAAGDRGYFMRLLYSTSKMSFYMLLAMAMPLMLNIDFILQLWLGKVPEGTATFLFHIIAFSLIDAYSAPLWNAAHATGNIKGHQLLVSSIKVLNIPLSWLMLSHGMAPWTALALKAALNFVCSIARPLYMVRLINLDFGKYIKDVLLRITVVFIVSVPLPIWLSTCMPDGFFRLLATSGAFLPILAISTYWLGLDAREREITWVTIRTVLRTDRKKNRQETS